MRQATSRTAHAYADHLRAAGGRVVTQRHARDDGLCVALYDAPPYEIAVVPMGLPRLSVNLRDAAVHGRVADERPRTHRGQRYSLFLTPASADAAWRKDTASRHLNLYFRRDAADEVTDGLAGQLRFDVPLLNAVHAPLRPWIDALESILARSGEVSDEAATGLARMILWELAGITGRALPVLSPRTLQRLRDHVAANVSKPIRVADLAREAGLSPGRFAVVFRHTAGVAPHRFVVEQRVRAVRELLRTSRAGLAEVAAACGFSSQQHMTTVMRRIEGTTPGRLRNLISPLPRAGGGRG